MTFLILSAGIQISGQNSTTAKNEDYLLDHAWNKQLQEAKEVCKEAGKKILAIRNSGKLISSDLILPNGKIIRQTNADIEATEYIVSELARQTPDYGILSQDQMERDPTWYTKESVWLINAIDGTKEFEKGSDDFHIQIGLLNQNESVVGVSYYPATDTYITAIKDHGAYLEQNGMRQRLDATSSHEKVLILSSSHQLLKPCFEKWGWIPDRVDFATLSSTSRLLKMIQGEASLYISLGASPLGKEKKGGVWNYGANVVIAKEAGLHLTTLKGHPLNLREPSGLLTEGVLLTTDQTVYEAVIHSNLTQ